MRRSQIKVNENKVLMILPFLTGFIFGKPDDPYKNDKVHYLILITFIMIQCP